MCDKAVTDNVLLLYEDEIQLIEALLSPPSVSPLSAWDNDADSDW